MTEDVMATVKESGELIVRIAEVFEAIFPQPHIFEVAK